MNIINNFAEKKQSLIGVVPVRIQRQFYSPYGEFYCFAVLLCFAQFYLLRKFVANKIKLNPQDSITLLSRDNNITLPQGGITLEKLFVFYIIYIAVVFMADSILRDKAKEFAKEIVFACRDMKKDKKESVLINQIFRSATSIGANIHEAQYAQ